MKFVKMTRISYPTPMDALRAREGNDEPTRTLDSSAVNKLDTQTALQEVSSPAPLVRPIPAHVYRPPARSPRSTTH